jgi:hypothetical protein
MQMWQHTLLVNKELRTLSIHLSSSPVFSGIPVAQSLVLLFCCLNSVLLFIVHIVCLCGLWIFYCLAFDLRLQITHMVYLNFSYTTVDADIETHCIM